MIRTTRFLPACVLLLSALQLSGANAERVIETSGVQGGLVAIMNADADLLGGFGDGYVVQGLCADSDQVTKARAALVAKGVYGPVTVKHWTAGHLPYADGVLNLLVIDNADHGIPQAELDRVLAPRGVAIIAGTRTTKAVPSDIDEWSHFLHGPDNNAVAKDTVVGPPRHLKWTGGPKYSRNHEIDSSVVAVVSATGRFIYIVDEAPPGFMGKYLPQEWALVARDAFSGVILWKVPMPKMGWTQWKPIMAKVDWGKLVAQRRLIPIVLPRRVVAHEDRVFAVLSYHAPLSILDAKSGKTLRTVEGTMGTDEVLFHEGQLLLSVRENSRGSLDEQEKASALLNRSDRNVTNLPGTIMAVNPDTGKTLWKAASDKLLPLTLTAGKGRVFYHTGTEVVCLDSRTGKEHWRVANTNAKGFRWDISHTLVISEDVLLVGTPKKLDAFNAATGELMWTGKGGRSGFMGSAPVDIYVIDGLIWTPASVKGGSQLSGRDLRTGEVKKTIPLPEFMYTPGHHIRCYRGKATENFLLENKRGIEMIDLKGDNFTKNDWVRGICRYGVMPCNGMIYSTPTPCSCYPAAQLTGFNALAPELTATPPGDEAARLVKGPALGKVSAKEAGPADWPCYRRNPVRNGVSTTTPPSELNTRWKTQLPGKLTQPVLANGKLFVASIHQHTVYALDAASGRKLWQFSADGRVDSVPTYHKGNLLFGSAGGWVYCLRAADGVLAWRYRAAPADDQIIAYNQLESRWPAKGTALVLDDVVYAAAGRNSYLDGGINLVGLDIATGKKLYEAIVQNEQQRPAEDKGEAHVIDGAMLDILRSDGTFLFMQGAVFDKRLTPASMESAGSLGIYASGGFTDDLAWNRNAWRCGMGASSLQLNKKNLAGMTHTGQILVHDDKVVYGVKYFLGHSGQSAVFYPGDGYKLFAHRVSGPAPQADKQADGKERGRKGKKTKGAKGPSQAACAAWELMLPVRVRAMTKAGNTLFIAGPPDVPADQDPLGALRGRKGAVLKAFSTDEGKELAELKLASPPVFDGLIAANGKLFMSTTAGEVICLGE